MYCFVTNHGIVPIQFILTPIHYSYGRSYFNTVMNINYLSNDNRNNIQYFPTTGDGPATTFTSISPASTEKSKNSQETVSPPKNSSPSFESFSKSLQDIMNQKSNTLEGSKLKETNQPKIVKCNQEETGPILATENFKHAEPKIVHELNDDPKNLQQVASNGTPLSSGENNQPHTIISNGNSIPSNSSFVSDSDDPVEAAMLRVADEVAVKLKSEIRELISQVDQWMINSNRVQPNSFVINETKDVGLRRRARNLIGEILDNKPRETLLSRVKVDSRMLDMNPVEKWQCVPKNILKLTLETIKEFSMLKNGDKVLICLSGGKDSLSLLHTMKQMQYELAKEGIAFTFGAVTIDPKHSGYNPKPLIPYLKGLGVPFFYEEQSTVSIAMEKETDCITPICGLCYRLKLGSLYATARKNGYNVLALGQNLDDLAERFLTSIFHSGLMRTMNAAYTVKDEDLLVIRPFANVREKDLRDFSVANELPIIPNNCPSCIKMPSEHHRIKQLLAEQEVLSPNVYCSLKSAMRPLLDLNITRLKCQCDNQF